MEIKKDEGRDAFAGCGEKGIALGKACHLITLEGEQGSKQLTDCRLVINDKDFLARQDLGMLHHVWEDSLYPPYVH